RHRPSFLVTTWENQALFAGTLTQKTVLVLTQGRIDISTVVVRTLMMEEKTSHPSGESFVDKN
ncbi:hypothetical protein ACLD23_22225, partial [Salmonella sp. 741265106_PSA]|uniref:hypothetical protein n=1 Tax=Salmonella sp. 741265106_PSA TaxID=3389029 RepID=UPI00397FFCF1